jgi:DNA-binding NarL/FixJ family response regulator
LKRKVLIVEDEFITAFFIKKSLIDLGYESVNTAGTAEEMISYCNNNLPDIIVLDIGLPGDMNGIDGAILLRDKINIPLIFMSGYSDPEALKRAAGLDPLAILDKPIKMTELGSILSSHFAKQAFTNA